MAKLAINGGTPVRQGKSWHPWPVRGEREAELLAEVAKSRWSYNGPKELEFARKFADYTGAKHGFCTTGGTTALEVGLRATGIGWGDEVILPAETFIATASAVVYVGAIPVFVDVDSETYCLDPEAIEAAISDRTRAIMPVHIFCCMADMDRIPAIARKHDLLVIEDCAHAQGAQWRGKGAGTFGAFGGVSFQESKSITCGEGGFVLTDDDNIAERVYSFKNCGRTRHESAKHVFGGNYRMTEFQAAVLLAQLERLPEQINLRNTNAIYLSEQLAQIDGIQPLKRHQQISRQGYYSYVFKYDRRAFGDKPIRRFVEAMNAEGVGIGNGLYGPVYKTSGFVADTHLFPQLGQIDYTKVHCPIAENAHEVVVQFGHSRLLGSKADMDDIAQAVRKIRANVDQL